MRMTPRVIVKKLIRRWIISSSARCCDRHALLMISWFTTMSQKNVSDNGSDWCSDTTRRSGPFQFLGRLDISNVTMKLQILGPRSADGMDLSFCDTDRRWWVHALSRSAGWFISSGVTECTKLLLDFRHLFLCLY